MLKINNEEVSFLVKQRDRVIQINLEDANKLHLKNLKSIRRINWRSIFLFATNRRKIERLHNLTASRKYFDIKLRAYKKHENTISELDLND